MYVCMYMMERIGPGTPCDMPPNAVLLADKGYAIVAPLLTPFRAAQIRRMPLHDQRLARRFNRKLSKYRIVIEHTIKSAYATKVSPHFLLFF